MITAIFVGALFMFLVARGWERELARRGHAKSFRYYLVMSFLDFLKIFLWVMVFYHALLVFLVFSDSVSTSTLVKLEETLSWIASFAKRMKLTSWVTLFVFLGLYVFGLRKWVPAFETYKKRTKQAYQFAVLLCCFTLLGSQVGKPALTLSVKIKRNRQEYGVLQNSVRNALAARVTDQIIQRIGDSLPPSPPLDMASIAVIDQDIRSLDETYREIRQEGGKSQVLKTFLKLHPPASEVDRSQTEVRDKAEETALRVESLERRSYSDIKESEEIVDKVEGNSQAGVIPDAKKKLTLELFKCLKDSAKKELLEQFLKELPILGPISDVLSSAVDKSAQAYIDRTADKIAASIKDQFDLERDLSQEARLISQSIQLKIDERIRADEKRAVSRWQTETRIIVILKVRAAREVLRVKAMRNPPPPFDSSFEASTPAEMPSRELSDEDRVAEMRRGIEKGWVVTRNPSGDPLKLFVHSSSMDLKYLIQESPDRSRWTVYMPEETFVGNAYGREIGTLPRPPGIYVGECGCQ